MKKSTIIILFSIVLSMNAFSQGLDNSNLETPKWLVTLIEKGSYDTSPILDIKSYFYKEELVFLVNIDAGCCDQYSAVLKDINGKTICHPFGGISGKGDMQCPDFLQKRTDEKTFWFNDNPQKMENSNVKSFKMVKQ